VTVRSEERSRRRWRLSGWSTRGGAPRRTALSRKLGAVQAGPHPGRFG